jgi:hypothetical protein
VGTAPAHAAILPYVDVHDMQTRANSSLPLA